MSQAAKVVAIASAELLELGARLGPDLVHQMVEEMRLIESLRRSTHFCAEVHFHEGRRKRGRLVLVRETP